MRTLRGHTGPNVTWDTIRYNVTVVSACACCQVAASATLCPTPRALCLDSEDATYMVALAAVR